MSTPLFHLAMPVQDLTKTVYFYEHQLGCQKGRQSERWVDFNFFGHQVSFHLGVSLRKSENPVDGHGIEVPHFGVILGVEEFQELAERFKAQSVDFLIKPYLRFAGKPGEQWTMFVTDPNGLILEFKAFNDVKDVFATDPN